MSALGGGTPPDARPVVIFLHIPKTGGLTLRHVFQRNYAREELFVPRALNRGRRDAYVRYLAEGGDLPVEHSPRYVEQLATMDVRRRERLRALMGHFWYGVHEALPRPAVYVTMLRDPIDRVLSMYHHRVTRHGLRLPIEEYVRTGRDVHMENSQTKRIGAPPASDPRLLPSTPELLDAAKRNLLEHFAVAGVTERFDESLLLMQRAFGWRDIRYVRRNVASERPRKERLPAGVLAILEERNKLDVELHAFARDSLDRDVASRGDAFQRELRRFRRWNGAYAAYAPLLERARQRAARAVRGAVARPTRVRERAG